MLLCECWLLWNDDRICDSLIHLVKTSFSFERTENFRQKDFWTSYIKSLVSLRGNSSIFLHILEPSLLKAVLLWNSWLRVTVLNDMISIFTAVLTLRSGLHADMNINEQSKPVKLNYTLGVFHKGQVCCDTLTSVSTTLCDVTGWKCWVTVIALVDILWLHHYVKMHL